MKRQKLMRFPEEVLEAVEIECAKHVNPKSRVNASMSCNKFVNLALVEKLKRIKR
jgi:hypothetical protein